MGVIVDGKVSGILPSATQAFAVHYPGYPSSVSRAIETLGGNQAILKAHSSENNKLELHFRPEDPYSHPAFSELSPCNCFLLKISKKKSNDSHVANEVSGSMSTSELVQSSQLEGGSQEKLPTDENTNLHADIVAHVPDAYFFNGMVDYQHVVAVHADVARRKKRNRLDVEEPHFDKGGLMDVDPDELMIILPPLFSPKDMPENLVEIAGVDEWISFEDMEECFHFLDFSVSVKLFKVHKKTVFVNDWKTQGRTTALFHHYVLRPSSVLSSKMKQEESVLTHLEDKEQVLGIDFDIKDILTEEIPKIVNWEEHIPQGSGQWDSQMAVSKLFDERPIWPKESLTQQLLDKGFKFSFDMLRRLLCRTAYYFSGGPFLRFWIRKGYDPRKNPDSRIYQRIDFRVPHALRRFCDANGGDMKQRWEDICAFRIFPFKLQTSLQLFELDDDYIQQEIKKLLPQSTCTYEAGWFSPHMVNCLRLRIMVRFLSVFPKAGAENLLKIASRKFERLKRECIKNASKLDSQGNLQSRTDVDIEKNKEPENVEGEEDQVDENNSEEEWDAYEELDLAEDDADTLLQSQSYMSEDNISRAHLQELFSSFPFTGLDDRVQDMNAIDEGYQIYENSDSYSD